MASFNRAETRPFFAGLLPEEKPWEAVARALGVSRQNDFAATRLDERVFALHPAFRGDATKLAQWVEAEPEWRETIARFAADPDRLAEIISEAIGRLRAYSED